MTTTMDRRAALGAALAGATVALGARPAAAQGQMRFALVPKGMNNPYFDLSRDGCVARAREINASCTYRGPVEHEPAGQVQIIQDLITQGTQGLAISAADADAVVGVIRQAREANIAVITFDADSPNSARQAYVGTDNREMGRELGRQLIRLRPQPGIYITQSGGPSAANLNERLQGLNEVLQGAGWRIARGSPSFCNDDAALAVQQLQDQVAAEPNAAAVVPVGGWAMFAPGAYRAFVDANRARVASGALTLVMPDTLPVQVQALRDGYAAVLVGQRPREMGARAMDILAALRRGERVEPITIVGLDVVTRENAAQFL